MPLALRVALSVLSRPARHAYGPDRSQVGDLHLPSGPGPHPVAVVLHGGYWQTRFGKITCRPLAADLSRRGWAVWNLEYRRLGEGRGGGGGWPETFADVAAGIDHLAALDDPRLDLGRVALIGHSAGGQLALWAANRAGLRAETVGAGPRVVGAAVVGLAPVTNLAAAGLRGRALVGGSLEQVPERWLVADPSRAAAPSQPTLIVHPDGDETIDVGRSEAYVEACRTAGVHVELVTPAGEGHRDVIDPPSRSWGAAAGWLEAVFPIG